MMDEKSRYVLVGFSDACERAYAAAVYLRISPKDAESAVCTRLVVSKTRVAPLSKQTIPRLELLGALVLARLISRVREALRNKAHIDREICLTDSAVVLCWVHGIKKNYKQYVQNRVDEIRSLTEVSSWNHVPGEENIADLPSRGCFPGNLLAEKERWFNGPYWLKSDIQEWPIRKTMELEHKDNEEKSEQWQKQVASCIATNDVNLEKAIDPKRYGTLKKLLRVTAKCIKFMKACKGGTRVGKELLAEDIDEALMIWVKHLQKEAKANPTFEKIAESLGVEEDKFGYLRCRGRLGRGKMPFNTKYPLLLPSHNYVTGLIIEECHEKVFHNGVRETLTELRSRYWVSKGRQRVKAILRNCILCKIMEGQPYSAPKTADLPEFRLEGGRAFRTLAVDFCGPVYIKNVYQGRDEKMHKAYISLFTCAASRMVHLELCPNLTTDAYIRSQQRLIGRRGIPKLIVSDNGRTFKGSKLKGFNAARGIRWQFNLAKAPWWGGMFERMIRSAKRCLVKAIGSARLTYEELLTVLIEVEAVLNSRPLTFIYEDDNEDPLTPSHLYCGRRLLDNVESSQDTHPKECDRRFVIQHAERITLTVDHFWRRWYKEYLTSLREVHKSKDSKKSQNIKVEDIVVIQEDGVKRNKWKVGKVEGLVTGRDGVVRGAILRTSSDGVIGHISRPLQKICPIEINDSIDTQLHEKKPSTKLGDLVDVGVAEGSLSRPKRKTGRI